MSIKVYDFFSGCGGSSRGFKNAGMSPVFALDFDNDAATTYQHNFPDVHFCHTDIKEFDEKELTQLISKEEHATLFCGCAPCQPFSQLNKNSFGSKIDGRKSLLSEFGKLIENYEPDYVFVENVPGIQKVAGNSTLSRFKKKLERLGYEIATGIVESKNFGVPQRRRRLVLLAAKNMHIELPASTHGPGVGIPYETVRNRIGHLPAIKAGEVHDKIPNHRASGLSVLNLQRLKMTPPEGNRLNWPKELELDCHAKNGYNGHTDVYGRMKWDEPATGLTTRCISLSNGRYGHPEQHRAISVREAASLQTFPEDFVFHGGWGSQAKQIGNAVPVKLAEVFGRHIIEHWQQHRG